MFRSTMRLSLKTTPDLINHYGSCNTIRSFNGLLIGSERVVRLSDNVDRDPKSVAVLCTVIYNLRH